MNHQEKVDLIYKEISDKTLGFGCKMKYWTEGFKEEGLIHVGTYIEDLPDDSGFSVLSGNKIIALYYGEYGVTIIGHPIHFGVAIDWLEKNYEFGWEMIVQDLLLLWKDKTLPIEAEENKEALDYMINLTKKGKK